VPYDSLKAKNGYIILPIIVKGEELEIEENEFSEIISVVRALASNDDRIVEEFRAIANKKRVNKGILKFDIDERLADKIDISKFTNNLELQIWNKLAKISWRPFEEARSFARNLNLKNQKEWSDYSQSGNKPADIPADPRGVYENKGWDGLGDWLGK